MRTQAQKDANKRYRTKTYQKTIQYSPNETEEYLQIESYCKSMDISYQRYVKDLIRRDMERMEQERNGGNQNGQ